VRIVSAALLRSDRDGDDLGRLAGFLEPDRFLDGDFVERIHRHFDVATSSTPEPSALTRIFTFLVDRPLHGTENFHIAVSGAISAGMLLVRCFLAPLPAVINWTVAAVRET